MASAASTPKTVLVMGMDEDMASRLGRALGHLPYRFAKLGDDADTDPWRCKPREFLARATAEVRASPTPVAGIIGLDDFPPSLLVPMLCRRLGLPANDLAAVLRCEHKWWSRLWQARAVPDAVPPFQLIDPRRPLEASALAIGFPFWLKPVKAYMSMFGFKITGETELRAAMEEAGAKLPSFVSSFDEILSLAPKRAKHDDVDGTHLLAEGLMSGHQCTLEGFVDRGRVVSLGVVDSIRFPNRVSFKRFDYPSRLPRRVQERMAEVVERFFTAIGYDNAQFNVEFFVERSSGRPLIIEANSRLSPQFADLFEKVDGVNTLQTLVELATGVPPAGGGRQGQFRMAASFVLRSFEDKLVRRVPEADDLARVVEAVPDALVRVLADTGDRLSTSPHQDSYSYRYGLVNVGADSEAELVAKYQRVRAMLPFEFE
ncbi:MAG: ATP-grasp domain-containing protein [Proteobacteria bacterium]|nr:ATP-grasp domain-containing protein [Pseudomonadota bacterium]MBI3498564.1 ATP-grasp domain-containing protein [Pseudomonadota bacterium]